MESRRGSSRRGPGGKLLLVAEKQYGHIRVTTSDDGMNNTKERGMLANP